MRKARVEDRRSGLILVLRLAFGLYLQRGGLALDALHEV